jgi:hypothetical protein
MGRWLGRVLSRVHELAEQGRIRFTHKVKPHVSGSDLYLKLLVRGECVIVSFHEEVNAREDPQEE